MRTFLKLTIPVEAGSRAIKDGSLGKLFQDFMAAAKPEAAYFTTLEGKRCMIAVFDLKDPSDLPALFEPLFTGVQAEVELAPAMDLADLRKGLGAL